MPHSDGEEKGNKRNRTLLAKGKPLSQQHQNFAQLLFQSATIADAAEKMRLLFFVCSQARAGASYQGREKQLNDEYMADAPQTERGMLSGSRDHPRNEIINLLADIARNGLKDTRLRVAAL